MLGPRLHDLTKGTSRELTNFGECSTWAMKSVALDPSGTVAAIGSLDGIVRVGQLTGGEPHPSRRAQGCGRQDRNLPGSPLAGHDRRGRHAAALADAGPLEAAAPHTASRRASREAAVAHEPARRQGPVIGHRLESGRRPVLRLEGSAFLVIGLTERQSSIVSSNWAVVYHATPRLESRRRELGSS